MQVKLIPSDALACKIILIKEPWLTECTTINQIFYNGSNYFLTHRSTRLGGGCLRYFKRRSTGFDLHHAVLYFALGTFVLYVYMHSFLVHLRCLCRPTLPNHFEPHQPTKTSGWIASIHGETKSLTGALTLLRSYGPPSLFFCSPLIFFLEQFWKDLRSVHGTPVNNNNK